MKITILSNGDTLIGVPNTTVSYEKGFLTVWSSFEQKIRLSELPQTATKLTAICDINKRGTATPELTIPLVDGAILDLSVFSPLIPEYIEQPGTNAVAVKVYGVPPYTFKIPIMNIACPNLGTGVQTDFNTREGRLLPVTFPAMDHFYTRPLAFGPTTARLFMRDGSVKTIQYEPKDGIDVTKVKKIAIATEGVEKVYPDVLPSDNDCSPVTLSWLNTRGSFDYLDVPNWSSVETISQSGDGGTISKREIACNFAVTDQNVYALRRLSISPVVFVAGVGVGEKPATQYTAKCSSTTGIKQTGSGLVKSLSLKFTY